MDAATITWYDQHADTYAATTQGIDMSVPRARFLRHLPTPARLLDVGCGSGRDALAFQGLGHAVVAIDASLGMVEQARLAGVQDVRHLAVEQMDFCQAFDGIWACASLLHLTDADWAHALAGVERALVPGGVVFLSLKHVTSGRDAHGRWFQGATPQGLLDHLRAAHLDPIEQVETPDSSRPGLSWIETIARKA